MTLPGNNVARRFRLRDELKKANRVFIHLIREMSMDDVDMAIVSFGLTREQAAKIADMSPAEIEEICATSSAIFTLRLDLRLLDRIRSSENGHLLLAASHVSNIPKD